MKYDWKPVPGYEGFYEVSVSGVVRSVDRVCSTGRPVTGIERAPYPDKDGYLRVGLYKNGNYKRHSIHRLVAAAFLPSDPSKLFVNHKNGIKSDNRVENLEWCTAKENIQHAVLTGLKPRSPNTYAGIGHNTCKGFVVATSLTNGSQLMMAGVQEYRSNGFREECIYRCLSGESKTHRGYTFERICKEKEL